MKIGVITFFNYCNFGAALQCYALSETLKKQGHEAEYIDYSCPYIAHPFRLSNIKKRGLFGYVYTAAGNIFYLPRRKWFRKFREEIGHTAPATRQNIGSYSDCYDKYIAGSDQIWSTKLTDFDKTYFLDFVTDDHKKFSYAASFGGASSLTGNTAFYKKLLASFEKISVREDYGKEFVKKVTGKEADIVLDPTLLLKKEEWEKAAAPERRKDSYLLVYQLGFSRQLIDVVKRIKKEKKIKAEYIPFPLGGAVKARCRLSLGPREWLALFRDAQYIITDSYHGIIFSILFEKKFLVVADGQHRNQRVISLLKHLGLQNRIIGPKASEIDEEIDYAGIRNMLEADRQESVMWLKNNI